MAGQEPWKFTPQTVVTYVCSSIGGAGMRLEVQLIQNLLRQPLNYSSSQLLRQHSKINEIQLEKLHRLSTVFKFIKFVCLA